MRFLAAVIALIGVAATPTPSWAQQNVVIDDLRQACTSLYQRALSRDDPEMLLTWIANTDLESLKGLGTGSAYGDCLVKRRIAVLQRNAVAAPLPLPSASGPEGGERGRPTASPTPTAMPDQEAEENQGRSRPTGPLGLKGAPVPALTGALAPARAEKYFLKGQIVNADAELCDDQCPPVSLSFFVRADDSYGSRQTGAQYPSDFTFGPPMEPGTSWRIDNPILSEFYRCTSAPVEGTVQPDERATNVAAATLSTMVTCHLNDAGRKRFAKQGD